MSSAKLHPLVATAAVAVTATSVLAAAALVRDEVFARHATAPAQAVAQLTAEPAAAPVLPATAPTAAPAPAAPRIATPAPRAASPAPRPVPPAKPVAAAPSEVGTAAEPMHRAPLPVAATPVCVDCGVVSSIREVKVAGPAQGFGAVGGAVVGGVIGNQIGNGSGRDAARILGVIGGAVAGHQIEKQARATVRYDVEVRMDDGSLRTVSLSQPPQIRSGDAVRVTGNGLSLADGRAIPRPAPAAPAARYAVDASGGA